MSESTVNPQVTDAVTQTNVKVLGEAPSMALATLYQSMASSLSLAMQNAVAQQQNASVIAQASTTQGVNILYSLDTAAAAVSTKEVLSE